MGDSNMLRRIGLLVMAFAIFLICTEAGLQLLGWRARATHAERGSAAGGPVDFTILCVGDSHTFGGGVSEPESYPAQLARRLTELYPERRFHVINVGFPGVNTAFITKRFEGDLLRFRPDVVVVWAGTNNRWNALDSESWEGDDLGTRLKRQLLRFELYRFARVLWMDASEAGEPIAGRLSPADAVPGSSQPIEQRRERRLSDREVTPGIRHDMEQMVALARSTRTPIVFISYPLRLMEGPNRAIAQTAARLVVPVVVTERDYLRARADGYTHDDLIVRSAGPHPSGILYGYVVESLLPLIVGALPGDLSPDRLAAPHQKGPAIPAPR